MQEQNKVSLDRVTRKDNEYIIKDTIGITAGRVFIIEMDKQQKFCVLRIKFYRSSQEEMLNNVLGLLLKTLFKNKDINKVNILVDEVTNISAFVNIGFTLEGVLEENIISNGECRSELLFGITFKEFEKNHRSTVLRLRGANIELKLLTPEDAKNVLDYYIRNKKYLERYEPLRDNSFYTLEVQRKIIIEEYKQYLNGSTLNLGIYKSDQFIGKIRLSNVVYGVFKNGILGYSIDEKQQGRGYMKEAISLLSDYCFEEMDMHRIEASALIDNIKSQRVLKTSNFKELGVNEKYLYINGEWRDHITFYKIKG